MGNAGSSTELEEGGIDEDAWDKLFEKLTGGSIEGTILDSKPRTDLGPRRGTRPSELNMEEGTSFLEVPKTRSLMGSRSSIASALGIASTPRPDPKDRTIDLDLLEKYVMGIKESYTLEIEYGIPRSQLCR